VTRVFRQEDDSVLGVVTDMDMIRAKDTLLTNTNTKSMLRG